MVKIVGSQKHVWRVNVPDSVYENGKKKLEIEENKNNGSYNYWNDGKEEGNIDSLGSSEYNNRYEGQT